MSSTQTTKPAPFVYMTVHTECGPIEVPCEPIDDWLAITPTVGMDDAGNSILVGDFTIAHRPTGRMVSEGPGCIECCRYAGRKLAELGVDWSALVVDNSREWAAGLTTEQQQQLAEHRAVAWRCDAEPCDTGANDEHRTVLPFDLAEGSNSGA